MLNGQPSGFDHRADFSLMAEHSACFDLLGDPSPSIFSGGSALPAIFYDPQAALSASPLDLDVFNYEYGRQIEGGGRKGRKGGLTIRSLEEQIGTQKNEKQRRERLGKKFEQLKSLIPNSTKPDRATIVSDTIDYIKELLRTVDELNALVAKKRSRYNNNTRSIHRELSATHFGDTETSSLKSNTVIDNESDHRSGGGMQSSWIQRRSKSTFVDVRIVEDEVYVKLEQRNRADCSLIVSRVLDELRLELLHFSGGNVGDCHIFMITTKTNYEGSPVYASLVARRFIEAMD